MFLTLLCYICAVRTQSDNTLARREHERDGPRVRTRELPGRSDMRY